jgi:protein involved in temperature-dependent protein secretion
MPSLYAETASSPNDQLRLGRMTDSKQLGEDLYRSLGLRLFLVDGEDKTLFEATPVEFSRGQPEGERTQAAPS